MNSTKKILGLIFALVALTLVMSLSIFAEETTEPTVYEFSDINSFKTAYNAAQAGDIIRMTGDTTVAQLNTNGAVSSADPIYKRVIIDLNGYTLTTTSSWGGVMIGGYASLINGTILHKGNTCAIKAYEVDRFEDLTIIIESQKAATGGISTRNHNTMGKAHINVIKDVKMIATGNYGIETYGQGAGEDKSLPVIDLIENVEIDSITYGLDLSCSIGLIKNSKISGSQSGISCKSANAFVVALTFEGDNEIVGANSAVHIQSGTATITADAYTDFISGTEGTVFSGSASSYNLDVVGFSVVDGVIVECDHAVTGGSCTERATCTVCGKVFDYVHNFVEDESKREPANCTIQGKAYYNCACGASEEVYIPRDPDAHVWVITTKEATHFEAGSITYNCKYGSCVGEEIVEEIEIIPHEYATEVTPATCEKDGYTTYTCTCGHTYTDNVVPALGHNYVKSEVEGEVVYTCTNCGESFSCEHEFALVGEYDATCTEDGYKAFYCAKCDTTKKEITSEARGHDTVYDWHVGGCATCGTAATPDVEGGKVSNNLGYPVYFAASWSDINANVSSSSIYKVIKLTADTKVPSGNNYAKVQNANILIDLGGHSITSSVGLAPLYLYAADGLVNGSIIHNYGRQALYVCNVNVIENINIIVGGTYANNTTAIYLANNASWAAGFEGSTGSYIGSMKNVTIDSKRDENGNYIDNIGLFNHGLEFSSANSIIGNLENVKVYSRGQAITIMAKQIGTMTNCVFDGTNIGLNIGNLQCNLNLVNCVVSSETLAVRIGGAASNALTFNFDESTSISSNGSVYYIPDSIKANEGFESLTKAVALVNGELYGTLEAALEALASSEEEVTTFVLIGDLTLEAPIIINKAVKFSFGGGTFKIPTTGDKTFTEMTAAGYTVTALNGAFIVVEGGDLTLEGDGTMIANENAIVVNGGNALITAGTYKGYDPSAFVSTSSCVASNDGVYTIAKNHTYDDGVMADKVTYKVDGDCEVCGYVRGNFAVDYVYYTTIEEAYIAAIENNKTIVLATNYVIDGENTWDLSGATFNFNGLTITVNGSLNIIGGTFSQDVTEYLADGYCNKYVDKTGYVVSVHEFVAGTPAEDGSVTYTCAGCDETYVINNSAINGEYYLGTDLVVFADGVLSAMGGEFTYTYNQTTGMVDVNSQIFFQVIDGEIYFRGAEKLHQHTGEGYIAEVQADGTVNYICSYCGNVIYVVDNAAVNGEYYLGTDLVVFENGKLTAMGSEFDYTYNKTTGMIDVNSQIFFQVIDGKIFFKGVEPLHQHVEGGYITEVTEPTCTDKGYTTYICQYCGPLFTDDEVEALGHSYVEAERTETEVVYVCTECGDTYAESVITHKHTEEIIPAVPGELRNPGMTSGVKCSECGEVLVAPVQASPDFRIGAVALNLGENISIVYKAAVPAGYENVYMVFEMVVVEDGEEVVKTFVVDEYEIGADGRYWFTFSGIRLQYMADLVTATVYAEQDGIVSANSYSNYSVKSYIVNQLKNAGNTAKLKTMLSDLLVLGAKTQIYANYKADTLMTADVDASILTTSTYAGVPADAFVQQMIVNDEATRAIADWKSVSLTFKDAMSIQFKLAIDPAQLENVEIKVTVPVYNGEARVDTYTAEDLTYNADEDRYILFVDNIKASQYGQTIVGDIYVGGEKISRTVNYSVNSYIQRNQDNANTALRDFLRAAYLYGESVFAYAYNK